MHVELEAENIGIEGNRAIDVIDDVSNIDLTHDCFTSKNKFPARQNEECGNHFLCLEFEERSELRRSAFYCNGCSPCSNVGSSSDTVGWMCIARLTVV